MKTLYMKSTYLFMVFAMILGFTLTGCSDDNSGDPSTSAEFPELKEFTCNAGETKDLSFTAGADWHFLVTQDGVNLKMVNLLKVLFQERQVHRLCRW